MADDFVAVKAGSVQCNGGGQFCDEKSGTLGVHKSTLYLVRTLGRRAITPPLTICVKNVRAFVICAQYWPEPTLIQVKKVLLPHHQRDPESVSIEIPLLELTSSKTVSI